MKTVRFVSVMLSLAILFSFSAAPGIPVYAEESDGFLYTVEESGAVLTGIQTTETDIVVPDKLGGYAVVKIDRAFKNKTKITSVILPDTVTVITAETFAYCSKLSSVVLSANLSRIGESAFFACTSLTEIDIPDSVTDMEQYAFSSCEKLNSVSLPNNLRTIKKGVFYGSSSLAEIEIPESVGFIGQDAFYGTAYYNNQENWENGALYLGGHLIKVKSESVSGHYTIKKNTKSICDYAFNSCTNLTALVMGKDLKAVGESIFFNCKNIKDIYYSGTVDDKSKISIGKDNGRFTSAVWHYRDSKSGDINGDNKIDCEDLTRLFEYLSGFRVPVETVAVDVNGDNIVDIKDTVRLFRYLSGLDVEIYSSEPGGGSGGDIGPVIHF